MPAIIAWLVSGLTWLFRTRGGSFIASAMLFFGVEMATRKFGVEPLVNQISQMMSGLGADPVGWLAFFNIDRYLTIILSAYAVVAARGVFLRKRAGP